MRVPKVFEHPLRQVMINRLLSHVRNQSIDDLEPLQDKIIIMFKSYTYKELIRPLVILDREVNKLSWQQMEIKYKVSTNQLRWIVGDFKD